MKILLIIILALCLSGSIDSALAGSFDIGLSTKSGITDSQSLYLGIDTEIKKISIASKLDYGKQNGLKIENKAFLRLGYDPKINDKWSLWFFDQAGYNKIRKIDFENFFGGGPKYTFHKNFSISAGLLQHHQKIGNHAFDINRLSFRLKSKINSFKGIVFYQPNLEDFDDYIFIGEVSVGQKITSCLSLNLMLTDQYRSRSEIAEKNELSLILSLGIEF